MRSDYWRFVLDYDELDTCVPLDGVFDHILDTCGPSEEEVVGAVWNQHKNSCSAGQNCVMADGNGGTAAACVPAMANRYAILCWIATPKRTP
jgi:hypothetical protein